eukprot:gene2710-1695_t
MKQTYDITINVAELKLTTPRYKAYLQYPFPAPICNPSFVACPQHSKQPALTSIFKSVETYYCKPYASLNQHKPKLTPHTLNNRYNTAAIYCKAHSLPQTTHQNTNPPAKKRETPNKSLPRLQMPANKCASCKQNYVNTFHTNSSTDKPYKHIYQGFAPQYTIQFNPNYTPSQRLPLNIKHIPQQASCKSKSTKQYYEATTNYCNISAANIGNLIITKPKILGTHTGRNITNFISKRTLELQHTSVLCLNSLMPFSNIVMRSTHAHHHPIPKTPIPGSNQKPTITCLKLTCTTHPLANYTLAPVHQVNNQARTHRKLKWANITLVKYRIKSNPKNHYQEHNNHNSKPAQPTQNVHYLKSKRCTKYMHPEGNTNNSMQNLPNQQHSIVNMQLMCKFYA